MSKRSKNRAVTNVEQPRDVAPPQEGVDGERPDVIAQVAPVDGAPTTMNVDAVAAVYVPLSRVHPWRDNPRWKDKKKRDKAVRLIAKSIRRFGFGEPMLARLENGEIIAGHTRWMAARRLGLEIVPVRFMDLPEHEAHALALADNKIAEFGQWDEDKLEHVIRQLEENDVDLEEGTGFDEDEIEEMLGSMEEDLDFDDGVPVANRRDGLKYQLVVECKDEEDQAAMLERLEAEGYRCKPLMS